MNLQKQNAHKLTVKATRSDRNGRHERNRVRGTVLIISKVVTYLVSSSFIIDVVKTPDSMMGKLYDMTICKKDR